MSMRRGARAHPLHAGKNIAAWLCDSMLEVHEAMAGGPRAGGFGSKVSMQIIRPRLHCGQSHSDTPVSRS